MPNLSTCARRTLRSWDLNSDHARIDTALGLSDSSGITSDTLQLTGNIGPSGGAEDLGTTDLPSQDTANCPLGDPAHLNPSSFGISPGDVEDLWLRDTIHLSDLKTAAEFVKGLQGATLDDPSLGMSDEALHRLQNPPCDQSPVVIDNVT